MFVVFHDVFCKIQYINLYKFGFEFVFMDYKEETKRVYDGFPEFFDEKFGRYASDFIKDKLEYVCTKFQKESKILDLGSGPGNHALFFKEKGYNVLCLDNSDSMLKKCREKGLETIKMDFEELDLPKKEFDVVWAYTSLLHIPKNNLSKVLSEIYQVMKDDGFFLLSLKEGRGEDFKEFSEGGRRLFSLYEDEEVRGFLKDKFVVIDNWKVPVEKGKNFMDYLCKKY